MPTSIYHRVVIFFSSACLLLGACSSLGAAVSQEEPHAATEPPATTTAPEDRATDADSAHIETGTQAPARLLPPESPPAGAKHEFSTDFSKHSVPYSDIRSGGPPKDGIPSIDNPQFVAVEQADTWLKPVEPIIRVQVGDEARAYPLQVLMWHEIVNDTVGDKPLAVTFCPLCNTAIVFERTVKGQVLDFGTTGRLRFSNLMMYDRQTETWWQQASGEAIAGDLTGTHLAFYPAEIIAWEDFRQTHPEGQVLSRETGRNAPYGQNPYAGYDNVNNPPFLYEGPETPDQLLPMARVLTVATAEEAVAYPYEVLQEARVVNDTVNTAPIVVFWQAGTASALDTGTVADGRDVGAANAYRRTLEEQILTFTLDGEQIVDRETGSTWNARGEALGGELAGQKLEPVVAINHFWFSWAAFKPETRIYQPKS